MTITKNIIKYWRWWPCTWWWGWRWQWWGRWGRRWWNDQDHHENDNDEDDNNHYVHDDGDGNDISHLGPFLSPTRNAHYWSQKGNSSKNLKTTSCMKLPLPKAVFCHISDKGECESHWFTGVWLWSIGEVSLGLDATPSLYSVHHHPHCQCHQVRSLIGDWCSHKCWLLQVEQGDHQHWRGTVELCKLSKHQH